MTEMPEFPMTDDTRIATLRERVYPVRTELTLTSSVKRPWSTQRSLRASEGEPS